MAAEPAETLAGVLVLGTGVLIAYGAYKDVPIFGPGGMLTGALEKGKLQAAPGQSTAGGKPSGKSSPPWYDFTAPGSGWNRGWKWF